VQEAFTKLDSHGIGYLTLMNFQANFSKHFDLSLKKDEVRLLFQEIDSDENGIVQYAEFEQFYAEEYIRKAEALAKDREVHNTQNEIFDHLLKMIK
jgi:Ca2+-binding EF-hand superfamily protein